jgi:hypothetical protein
MTTPRTFAAGDEVYDINGRAGAYVARAAGGHIVEPIYEHGDDRDDGISYGEAVTWREVFATPPTEKLHADTAAALEKLADTQRQLSAARDELRAFERDEKARMERLKQHKGLEELDRYLAGEITHYVAFHDYYNTVEVIPIAETIESHSSNNGYGLLTLLPSYSWDKTVRWSVTYVPKTNNRYSDSRTKSCIPCCGEDAANEMAQKVLKAISEELLGKERSRRHYVSEFIACCEKFSVEVPQELRVGMAAEAQASIQRQLDDNAKKREDLERQLAALGAP